MPETPSIIAISTPTPHRQVLHRAHHANASHPADRPAYSEVIAKALEGVDDWLVVGPAETKSDFVNHVRDKGPKPRAGRCNDGRRAFRRAPPPRVDCRRDDHLAAA